MKLGNVIEEITQSLADQGRSVFLCGPQEEESVATIERALGIRMPPSYREFLLRYGAGDLGGALLSGLCNNDPREEGGGNVVFDTRLAREEQALPETYIVVQNNEGVETIWCLDTSRPSEDTEYPIVRFDTQFKTTERLYGSFREMMDDVLDSTLRDA